MADFKPSVIPFPKRFEPQDFVVSAASPLQAAAEIRVEMLHTLFGILLTVDGFPESAMLREVFHNASQLLNDVVVLYRRAIVQAQGRAEHE